MTVTELAIKRPVLIIVLFIALGLLGCYGYSCIKYELLPDMDVPTVSVNTTWTGASVNEVERMVTRRIEDACSAADKIDNISSTSYEGKSNVTIQFTQEANIDLALMDIQRRVFQILSRLPTTVTTPSISKMSIEDQPIMMIGATSNMKDTAFYELANDYLKMTLSNINGVGQVSIYGGHPREIRVNVFSSKLQEYGMSATQILTAVQNANLDYPAGDIKDKDFQISLRVAGAFTSVDQMRDMIVGVSKAGGLVRLGDVAEVLDGMQDYQSLVRLNGQICLGLVIQKQSDANAVEVSKRVRVALTQMEKKYRQYNVKFVIANDTSTFTVDAAKAVQEDLLLAVLLVAIVMFVFLHSFRNSMIVMIAIPTSLVANFIGMWALGLTLNIITLLALSLVIGILVDDAIVVLENIYRHLEMGEERAKAALTGRNEIGFTALSITMVDVVVYMPLTIVTGLIGGIVRSFSEVVVVSTLMSLFVSFTVTPLLASRFSRREQLDTKTWSGRFGAGFERLYKTFTNDYLKVLKYALEHRALVLVTAAVMFVMALSLVGFGFIGSEFIAQSDQSQINVELELTPGTLLDNTNRLSEMIEGYISRNYPEVQTIFAMMGVSGRNQTSTSGGLFYLKLVPKEQRTKRTIFAIEQKIQHDLAAIPGLRPHVSLGSAIQGLGGTTAPVQFEISGPTYDTVRQTADKVVGIVSKIPGTRDVRLSSVDGLPEMRLVIDRQKLANLGLDINKVGTELQLAYGGDENGIYEDINDGNDYTIGVFLDWNDRYRADVVRNLTVLNNKGQLIPLNQFATLVMGTGPTKIERYQRVYAIMLSSQVDGRTGGAVGEDIFKALDAANFPPEISFTKVGDLKNQGDSFGSLALALVAAIIFVYLIMAALYNSFIYPFSVLFSIPFAVIGAFLALALTRNSLSVFSIMGLIMQVGLVSKNAILLVDFTNRAREEGMAMKAALMEAARERLRPILMTTLTMIFGMLPLSLSNAAGSEFKKGMGWGLIGGLLCSMLMTLVVVPVVYTLIEQLRGIFVNLLKRYAKNSDPYQAV